MTTEPKVMTQEWAEMVWAAMHRPFHSTVRKTKLQLIGTDLPFDGLTKALEYGIQRYCNDGTGGADVSDEEAVTRGQAKIASLLTGNFVRRGSGVTIESDDAIRIKLIRSKLSKAKKEAMDDLPKSQYVSAMLAMFAKNEGKMKAEFDAAIAMRDAMKDVDVEGLDLDI